MAPPPDVVLRSTLPAWASAQRRTTARPRPVPFGRVEKNGVKTRSRRSAGTPSPSSLTETVTWVVSPIAPTCTGRCRFAAWSAFATRFTTAWRTRRSSQTTCPSSPSNASSTAPSGAPAPRVAAKAAPRTSSSNDAGCRTAGLGLAKSSSSETVSRRRSASSCTMSRSAACSFAPGATFRRPATALNSTATGFRTSCATTAEKPFGSKCATSWTVPC